MGEPHLRQVDFFHLRFEDLTSLDLYNIFRAIIHDLSDLSVPCYFFFSGYLFFRGMEEWDMAKYKQKLNRRIHSLVIPYVIWNMVPVMITFTKSVIHPTNNILQMWIGIMNEKGWLHIFWDSRPRLGQTGAPEDMPLWFLRDLIIMSFLLTPFIWGIVKKGLGLVTLLILFFLACLGVPEIEGFSYSSVMWFGVGAYISIRDLHFIGLISKYRLLLSLVFGFSVILSIWLRGSNIPITPFQMMNTMFGVPLVLFMSTCFNEKVATILTKLSAATFFVFASHNILLLSYSRAFVNYLTSGNIFTCYLIPPILTVIVCTVLFFLLRRITPRLCAIINGR